MGIGRWPEAYEVLERLGREAPYHRIARVRDFEQRQADAQKRGVPSILLTTLPKSASEALFNYLSEGLDMPTCWISGMLDNEEEQPVASWLSVFAQGGAIAKEHMAYSPSALAALRQGGVDRVVCHVRDPRQQLLGMLFPTLDLFRFTNGIGHEYNKTVTMYSDDPTQTTGKTDVDFGAKFLELSLERQIDMTIERISPRFIRWINSWVQFAKNNEGFDVHLGCYESMVSNKRKYIEDILDFYNIDHKMFNWSVLDKKPQSGVLNFRKGDPNEWRSVMTPKQQERLWAMMPSEMVAAFGWLP